jgi:hypothetical protein
MARGQGFIFPMHPISLFSEGIQNSRFLRLDEFWEALQNAASYPRAVQAAFMR